MAGTTQTDWLKFLIDRDGEQVRGPGLFYGEIMEFLSSPRRKEMLTGENYYRGKHDILKRVRTVIGPNGELEIVNNLPNNRVVDNQYARVVDQKVNYLLGKPITLEVNDADYAGELKSIFGPVFRRTLRMIGEDTFNCGIGWIHPCYDREGNFVMRRIAPYELLPFWADEGHTVLDCAIRVYEREQICGDARKKVMKAELFTREGMYRFDLDGGLIPDGGFTPYYSSVHSNGECAGSWPDIPLVPFRAGGREIPLIRRVKTLQDGLNEILSDYENRMQEDSHNTVLVIKNYDGENLGEFRRNLAAYGAVKVRTADGADGGVETLNVSVDSSNFEAILSFLKRALIENAKGFDVRELSLLGSPNQMAIQSMYADIDLDAGAMELEFAASFSKLMKFAVAYMENKGIDGLWAEDVEVIFNRDVLINESESIDNCVKSKGILSDETILYQHPWTSDFEKEKGRLETQL